MLSLPFYLLLTISIVTKCTNAYALDGNVSMNTNEDKSQADEKRSALFDGSGNNGGSGSGSHRSTTTTTANDADNQIQTSILNVTAIDNSMDVPKPNDATTVNDDDNDDATTFQTSRQSRNTLTEVETGKMQKREKKTQFFASASLSRSI